MKKLSAFLLTAAISISIYIGGSTGVQAEITSNDPNVQVVPTTQRVSRKVYRNGRWVTVTTWKNGKRVTRRVWQKGRWVTVTSWKKGKRYSKKIWRKGNSVIMGPPQRRP